MFRIHIHKVSGHSMAPTYTHGDYIVSIRWPHMSVSAGTPVVVSHPKFNHIVKRISHIDKAKRMKLAGDNSLSVDTEKMGWVDKQQLVGKVILRFSNTNS
ncbi:MAG: S24 family peptidase [Paraglaciecola sp.]|uniref:S24 family peptidase n=1 Tax=Paraglaciecola sp. TaxID=1920173 RepID=UPI0032991230